eukprot:scaffold125424_cov30-Tisochrysis_lutea.AAC.2
MQPTLSGVGAIVPASVGAVSDVVASSSSSSARDGGDRRGHGSEEGTPFESCEDPSLDGRKKAPIWRCYKAHADKKCYFVCQEMVQEPGTDTKRICGAVIGAKMGPTPLWNHHAGKHKRTYQVLKGFLDVEKQDNGVAADDQSQKTLQAVAFTPCRKEEVDLACARWLVKSARPLTYSSREG